MLIDDTLIRILRCPLSKVPVRRLTRKELVRVNSKILQQGAQCYDGHIIHAPLEDGLVTIDHQTIYPIRSGIVVMQQWESLATSEFPTVFEQVAP